MCFHISYECPDAKIAKNDILVFKLLEKTPKTKKGIYYSPFKGYRYNFNKQKEFKSKNYIRPEYYYRVNEGIHCYRKIKTFGNIESSKYVVSIIPKGTRYYYNNEETVSDKIICLGIINNSHKFSSLSKKKQLEEITKFVNNKDYNLSFKV